MPRQPKVVTVSDTDREQLEIIANARTSGVCYVARARMILMKAKGMSDQAIAEELDYNEKTVNLWVNRYANRPEGTLMKDLLRDAKGRGRKREIIGEARVAVTITACTNPKDFGLAEELWSKRLLAKTLRENAAELGAPRLATICPNSVYRILEESDIQPWRIQYYCDKRDPEFDSKMGNLLKVYKVLSEQFTYDPVKHTWSYTPNGKLDKTHVVSLDEKPGIPARGATSASRNPVPQTPKNKIAGSKGTGYIRRSRRCLYRTITRDYEYRRYGTVSLIGAIDLLDGHVFGKVTESHNSGEYIGFLQKLDAYYPKGDKIVVVLDNLKVHLSKQTREYLATIPGRFEFVFTPKHGSWLNMIEGFFGKLSRQLLRGIDVQSKDELANRIMKYLDQVNADPVVHHWTWGLEDVDTSVPYQTVTLLEDIG